LAFVGIATLRLLDPRTQHVLDADRWRHATELTRLLLDLGHRVAWWQLGGGWRGELLPAVPIHGVLRGDCQLLTWPRACEDFLERAGGVDAAIYFDLVLAYPQVHESSIAVAHGIDCDDPLFECQLPTAEERDEWKRRIEMAVRNPRKVVATDIGFIHWATATWPGLQHAFEYIPGFAIPSWGVDRADHPLTILFPGTLAPEHGISETIRAMEVLLARHPHVRFWLTGPGTPAVLKYLAAWVGRYPGARLDPRPLTAELLREVDIVLFPVKSGHGPALACLQAMAAGKAVVVGYAGGLTGLVLQEHTGLIVRQTADDLVEAVEELLANHPLRESLGRNAQEAVANGFALEQWRKRWTRLIAQVFGWEGEFPCPG